MSALTVLDRTAAIGTSFVHLILLSQQIYTIFSSYNIRYNSDYSGLQIETAEKVAIFFTITKVPLTVIASRR